MTSSIGAVVITRNEATNIEACLTSLRFCEERVVVDSFSSDDTVEIACREAENVYRREFVHYADQKNWAVNQLRTDWVLVVDADERVTPQLAAEIQQLAKETRHEGWWIYRSTSFFGRFIRYAGWDRDRVLRFYRRDRGRYEEKFVHEEVILAEGATAGRCRNRLLHFSYADWDSTFWRFLSYSRSGARDRAQAGRRGTVAAVLVKPLARFLREYVVLAGWRDGLHGLVLCEWSAMGVFLREVRLLLGEFGNEDVNRGRQPAPRVECVQGRSPIEA
jgi:glycosyltransferase involved in cell wall biosynthesis